MIRSKQLTRALQAAVGVDEFTVTHTRVEGWQRSVGDDTGNAQMEKVGETLQAHIFTDTRRGRGSSRVQIDELRSLSVQIRDGTARALAAIGPAWQLRPPSAPARVVVSDPAWQHEARDIVDETMQDFTANLPAGMRALQTELAFARTDESTIVSNGFENRYRHTLLSLFAIVQAEGGRAMPMQLHARRQSELQWTEFFARAEKLSRNFSSAGALLGQSCDLVLRSESYVSRAPDDLGLWAPLAEQCSAKRFREGTARYGLGQSITQSPPRGDALSMSSEGSAEFGLQSAPFGPEGESVRRFAIVEAGVSAGLSIDHREASLRGSEANGGVRNVHIGPGTQSLLEILRPGQRPVLVVDRLESIASDERGRMVLHIDCATLHEENGDSGVQERRSLGGVISGDLYQWLKEAYYSREMHSAHGSRSPKAIRFNNLRVLA